MAQGMYSVRVSVCIVHDHCHSYYKLVACLWSYIYMLVVSAVNAFFANVGSI